ncbi:SAM-dependent methyltransferase [Tetragenococcus koreensis]|uniref:N-6 DNA methylase n=1 Tax=Tetragenococcus koreensis TaxID=290335 RepID=UPI001F281AB6|nr:N-6 DNA methylase [Tetragenococcus koreensis]MCF1614800.1 SAM-dependent methyltransferase [Tetragenococcus koreensis]MDN6251052.1 SAM-dependent methyltransferase [Tetragenococcus koreensis]MDN6345419.1 SAM-dependent methyltransferase [Tetragenococcus koreensis]MDN6363639.1 SAM-dependent methyltransferase [Tetragenococcus koreensis]MDN6424146.1 SAM-dependent methyltransferase [Tetragenococcus koreensis]
MELSELTKKTLELFKTDDINRLSEKIMSCVLENNIDIYQSFKKLVDDLSVDWLQKIYQYYLSDRKDKMQDYTPKTLAVLLGKLATEESDEKVIDMCAGSGALTIQVWDLNHDLEFECLEFDENVIPILLFNLSLRNIKATVKHMDVLENDIIEVYEVDPQEEFGKVVKVSEYSYQQSAL